MIEPGGEKMDWGKQLNEAINYIEENLAGEISYDTISKIAQCSIYNFQRMFSYIADKPLSEYIRSRRLTLAAFEVIPQIWAMNHSISISKLSKTASVFCSIKSITF